MQTDGGAEALSGPEGPPYMSHFAQRVFGFAGGQEQLFFHVRTRYAGEVRGDLRAM